MKKVLLVFLTAFAVQSIYSQCDQCDEFYLSNFSLCIVDGGCSDSSALNYSGDACSSETFINENCDFGAAGCTCPDSYNYDPSALVDDGSCVVLSGGCGDTTAENYSGDACATAIFATPDCQYGSVELGEFSFTITDANMTVQVGADVVTFNGEEPPVGSLLGAFFTNDAGELQCAGYQPWTGDQLAIAVWASESGLDNGFASGESITWGLSISGESFAATTSTMNTSLPFSNTFTSNGFGQLLGVEFSGELTAVLGCTDETAINYNLDATVDDGSCYNLVWDEPNTGANATIAITPEGPNVSSITFNGEPFPIGAYLGVFFTNDDGQFVCGGMEEWTGNNIAMAAWGDDTQTPEKDGFFSGEEYTLFAYIYGQSFLASSTDWQMMGGFSNTYALNGFGMLINASFEGEITSTPGCMDDTACNYDLTATVDDGSCTYADGIYDCDGVCYNDIDGDAICNEEDICPNDSENDADGDGVCESDEINGCTDSQACNYDSSATDDNGTCIQPITWYWDTDGDGFGDDTFTMEACSQPGPEFVSNIDDICPLDPENDTDGDGVCESDEVEGCTDSTAFNFDENATDDDGSCLPVILGCTDSQACNYNSSANLSDDSCTFAIGCDTCEDGVVVNNDIDGDGVCDADEIVGCTDSTAFNFDENATDDDGSCLPVILGCTDSQACNYNSSANLSDGSCTFAIGCDTCEDGVVVNNDIDGDGVCDADEIVGCTDSTAFNFDENATDDDGSCLPVILGCTDSQACNYNSLANVSDGLCDYAEEGYDCLGELLPIDSPWGNNLGCDPFNSHTIGFTITEGLEEEDYIGLFFTDENGNLVFSQGTEYLGDVFYFNVCGDDETTDEKDGFSEGEEFIWQIFSSALDCSLPLNVEYSSDQPNQGSYSVNGISVITEISYDQLVLEFEVVDVDCYGQNNGLINALVSGGSGNYSFEWSNGETTQAIANLSPGIYSVVVSDDNGCLVEESQIEIMEPSELIISGTTNNVSCNGSFNGSIDLSVSGGLGGYSFYWSNGEVTEDLNSLPAGNYSVVVSDSNSCSQTIDFEITEPEAMAISENHFNVSCNGGLDGSIDITVSGGTGLYDYSWSNGESLEDISNLSSGTYSVTATDENGCSISTDIEVTEPEELSISFTSTPGEYSDCNSGQLSVLVENGTGPYLYAWNNGQTTSSIFGLCSGDYSVIVTDANGCTVSGSANVDLLIPEGWEVNESSVYHEIMIPADADLFFDGVGLNIGDFIGVFYVNSEGGLSCGGYTIWEGDSTSILAYGNNGDVDGFDEGEQFQWKVYNGETNSGFSIYDDAYEFERFFSSGLSSNNYSMSFDGVDDYVDLGLFCDYNLCYDYQSFSVNLKVKVNEFGYNNGGQEGVIIGTYDTDANYNGFNLHANPDNKFIFQVGGNGNNVYAISQVKEVDTWYDVTIVLDQLNDIMKIYIDGVLEDETSIANIGTISNNYSMYLGGAIVYGTNYFSGSIDDVSIWSSSLSQSEIDDLFCNTLIGLETNLVTFWNFEEGVGDYIYGTSIDTETNGIINGATYSEDVLQSCLPLIASQSGIQGLVSSSFQTIPLNENPFTDWDMISTYINSNEDVESIISPILNNFIIIKDASGLVYWPAIPVSTLDNLNSQEAYAIKTWSPEEINISGDFIQPEFTNNQWVEGWNFVSYPRYWSNSIETSLSSVLSDIKLLKDDSGNIFWPELGINTMSNMEAGEGYLLKLNNGSDFSFDSNSDFYPQNPFDAVLPGGSISSEVGARYGSHIENFEIPINTYSNMTIGFPESSLNVEVDDELAVFDQSGNIVGVSKLQSGNNYIVVWGDDEETIDKDGLLVGEEMTFQLWKKQENKIFRIIPNWSEGDDSFTVNGINIAESIIVEISNTEITSVNYFPNPASSLVNLEFSLENDSKLDICLVDNLGKLVFSNYSLFNSGVNRITLPLDNVSKGIYYIELRGEGFVERLKLDVVY